jgi:ribosomal-protein-alanine N-acetyltransferase
VIVLETERLILRRLTREDAGFILELVNDPDWLRFIGDKGVRNLEDAARYIATGPMEMYSRFGFGMYRVERREGGAPIGICGLIRREGLDAADIGFALLPAFRREGFAREAAEAVLVYGRTVLGLGRIAAITSPENDVSAGLLGRLGFRFAKKIRLSPEAPDVRLFTSDPDPAPSPPV